MQKLFRNTMHHLYIYNAAIVVFSNLQRLIND